VLAVVGLVSGDRLVDDGVTTGERSDSVAAASDVTAPTAAVVSSSAHHRFTYLRRCSSTSANVPLIVLAPDRTFVPIHVPPLRKTAVTDICPVIRVRVSGKSLALGLRRTVYTRYTMRCCALLRCAAKALLMFLLAQRML